MVEKNPGAAQTVGCASPRTCGVCKCESRKLWAFRGRCIVTGQHHETRWMDLDESGVRRVAGFIFNFMDAA